MKQVTFPINKAINIAAEFIPSSSNIKAREHIKAWPDSWGVVPYPYALILLGQKMSGKSLLARSWAKKATAIVLDKANCKEWLGLLEGASAAMIDDISSFSDEDLLHIFNLCHEGKKHLLIIAECDYLKHVKLPDLSSRLNSCNLLRINQPDDELIKVLLFKFFSDYSVSVSPELIDFLSKVLPRNTVEIKAKLEIINSYALAKKRKVTIPLVNELLQLSLL